MDDAAERICMCIHDVEASCDTACKIAKREEEGQADSNVEEG